jgi:hypothetical protein
MIKVLLLSGLLGPVVIALLNSRSRRAPRALRRVIIQYSVFNLTYAALLIVLSRWLS